MGGGNGSPRARLTEVDGVVASENSSSRGIGTHTIGTSALRQMAGVMRWAK